MVTETRRIGVLTSGGDAPGMNAAIRAVVRSALAHREVLGIRHGYTGLMNADFQPMDARSVGGSSTGVGVTKLGHIQRGGTPRIQDRIIASQLGAAAAEHAVAGEFGLTLGMVNGRVTSTPLAALTGALKPLDRRLFELAQMLAQ